MITFVIANKKGGVGKTTTAFNLAAGLQHKGKEVLLIDLDGQCSLTRMAGLKPNYQSSSFGILSGDCKIVDAICTMQDFDLIPGNQALTTADKSLPPGIGRNMRLKEALDSLRKNEDYRYDYCIIDTPPALGIVTINAFVAADFIIIPAEANELSTDGILSVLESAEDVKKYANPYLEVFGILLTRFRKNTTLGKNYKEIFEQLAYSMHTIVFETPIRESIVFSEIPSIHRPIFDYKPRSAAAKDYQQLVDDCAAIAEVKEESIRDFAEREARKKAALDELIKQHKI